MSEESVVAIEDRILEVRGVSNWSSLKMLEHQDDDESEPNNEESLGRGKCSRIPSVKLQDFVTYTLHKMSPSDCSLSLQRK